MIVPTHIKSVQIKRTMLYVLVKRTFCCSGVYKVPSVLASNTIVRAPPHINVSAGRSYLQMNFSSRNLIDKNVLKIIPEIILVETRTKSIYGSETN